MPLSEARCAGHLIYEEVLPVCPKDEPQPQHLSTCTCLPWAVLCTQDRLCCLPTKTHIKGWYAQDRWREDPHGMSEVTPRLVCGRDKVTGPEERERKKERALDRTERLFMARQCCHGISTPCGPAALLLIVVLPLQGKGHPSPGTVSID